MSLCRLLSPLLGEVPSRRYLCESFPSCLNPYSGCFCGAFSRFFPQNFGLPCVRNRSALGFVPERQFQSGRYFRRCSHSLMFRPEGLLATQIVPTAMCFHIGQPWLFHTSRPREVTLTWFGYANRLNREIDGWGLTPHKIRSLVGCSSYAAITGRRTPGLHRGEGTDLHAAYVSRKNRVRVGIPRASHCSTPNHLFLA